MALIRKEKIFCKIFDEIKPFEGGHSKDYNAALNWAATQIRKAEEARGNPCDFCMYAPPSSSDGKPCTMCPAVAKGE